MSLANHPCWAMPSPEMRTSNERSERRSKLDCWRSDGCYQLEQVRRYLLKATDRRRRIGRQSLVASSKHTIKDVGWYTGCAGFVSLDVRIDILMPLSTMSHYISWMLSRRSFGPAIFHIFAYLKHHARSTLVFDPSEPTHVRPMKNCSNNVRDWSEFYPGAKETIPLDAPVPRGRFRSERETTFLHLIFWSTSQC